MLTLAIISTVIIGLFILMQSIAAWGKDGPVAFLGVLSVNMIIFCVPVVTFWVLYAK